MTSYLNAMGAALAVRDACKRQVEKGRPIDHLNIDVIVNQAVDGVAGRHHCADDVFDGIAETAGVVKKDAGAHRLVISPTSWLAEMCQRNSATIRSSGVTGGASGSGCSVLGSTASASANSL